jgi:hypothetical protein
MMMTMMAIVETIILIFKQWFSTKRNFVPQESGGNIGTHFWLSQLIPSG